MFRIRSRIPRFLLLGLAAAAALYLWYRQAPRPLAPVAYGVTFSTLYAQELGLDWKAAYLATLDDLGVRKLRLPVYWDSVEAEEGTYDWSDVDWMLDEAFKRDADVILAVGRKTPRWPECHIPAWAAALDAAAQQERVSRFLAAEIAHFKAFPAVKIWQVENEPLFRFGLCPPPDRAFLKKEVELVRAADARPVMLTDSGEMSSWLRTGPIADVLGISLYRMVWNDPLGGLYWPVSPMYYADRARLIRPFVKSIIISELQAEPWFHDPVEETPIETQFAQMNPERFAKNVRFAASTGASEIYLWGVEWWYWLKLQGRSEMWNAAQKTFIEHSP